MGKATHACLKWGGVNAIEKGMKIVAGMIELERLWLATRRSPILPPPTITIGRIEGGMAGSQVPGDCRAPVRREVPAGGSGCRDGRERKNTGEGIKAEVEAYLRTVFARATRGWRANPPALTWYQHCIPHYLDPAHPLVDIDAGAGWWRSPAAALSRASRRVAMLGTSRTRPASPR